MRVERHLQVLLPSHQHRDGVIADAEPRRHLRQRRAMGLANSRSGPIPSHLRENSIPDGTKRPRVI
ncbi:hypothetical protein [Bradyrhizobium iriomotense]|uniref:hypothetical protein n=1 Tax=Bradyrhizobium iriomotense TaxID=441950 RepID=UPI0024E0BC17|nr:hypothetical protein [Bradyrhizobium iriomotense]